ncbi:MULTISPECIES: hypothetical protein [Flavobacterium]|uniref:Lipoprotein n=1 Tax=Flavobacterium jumunjinense TaxID=998845 RepID=A0ABV5GT59_9FLAO|nr:MULTISPECIES: hypothetical protein [Flavobacterium]
MTKKLLLILLYIFISCKETNQAPPVQNEEIKLGIFNNEVPAITPDDRKEIDNEERRTYHVDEEYKYEYRTGRPDHYEYNYDIIGLDSLNNEVTGNVNTCGKFGAGIIRDKKGNEKDIEVEWYENGKMKGKDTDGMQYELKAE